MICDAYKFYAYNSYNCLDDSVCYLEGRLDFILYIVYNGKIISHT